MPLIYAGIDEAGYGPLLGPLCVGLSVFRLESWAGDGESGSAPNLWKHMQRVVCRETRDQRNRIAVDDSKKLKLSNSSTTKHPLTHLERGVLAFLAARCPASDEQPWCCPGTDHALLHLLGVSFPNEEWYGGTPCNCPMGTSAESIQISANTLRLELARESVATSVLELCCEAMGESVFNQLVEAAGTKAAATESALVKHLWTVWDRYGEIGAQPGSGVRVVCDRQGGRVTYTAMLRRAFPGADVRPTHESETQSRYEIRETVDGRTRAMHVLFLVESERQHLPVALASMTAKLTRELLMHRFNQFWRARLPELKPTAGYSTDARRWLQDAEAILSSEERHAMIRRA